MKNKTFTYDADAKLMIGAGIIPDAPKGAKDLFEQQQEQQENQINEQADEHDRLLEAWLGK